MLMLMLIRYNSPMPLLFPFPVLPPIIQRLFPVSPILPTPFTNQPPRPCPDDILYTPLLPHHSSQTLRPGFSRKKP